ncbi:putative gamma-tubulin complex component 4-like [Apostichopus japonicus]|uniref:Gamma-tubulin complex component n=1 Tax=Stichopus japonicus TaxID=307972 RepID=A0A2G8L5G6_STIJA|nr:putative gamma-tubulin complex component 4-like [Apostichopus japonicus]
MSELSVVGGLPHLSPSEEARLNRLCLLSSHFKRFESFIKRHGGECVQKDDENVKLEDGLYLRSFCSGLDEALSGYRKTLLVLEEDILNDPTLTMGHIICLTEPYQGLFVSLSGILDKLETGRYHGCQILDMLQTGEAATFSRLILFTCHRVMFDQLTTWLLNGLLLDEYGEFFLHKTNEVQADQTNVDDEDDLGIGGITGRQMKRALKVIDGSDVAHDHFAINAPMLPSYLPLRVAEKILFAGESVQMFESKKQKSVAKYTDPVLGSNEEKFAKKLTELKHQSVFSIHQFEIVVNEIRSCVAEHLWTLVVEEHKLVSELIILKDFTSSEEASYSWHSSTRLNVTSDPPTSLQNIIQIWPSSKLLIKCYLKMTILCPGFTSQFHLKKAAQEKPPTPQLPPSNLYNKLFKFLLAVKRVQLELQQCWIHHMDRKNHVPSIEETTIWQLRSHMAFLIDSIQYYLQVDVLDTQFSLLLSKIQSTRDFEAVRVAHDQFLTSLLVQCFLLTKPVHHCLMELLDLCHSFAILLLQTKSFEARQRAQVDSQAQGFNHLSSLLFKILSGAKGTQSNPHLSQLLLRLDFNKFYSLAEGAIARLLPKK